MYAAVYFTFYSLSDRIFRLGKGRNPIRRGRGVGDRTEKLPLDCLANLDALIF